MRSIILILTLLSSVIASAQNQKISVSVTERATREPIIMATVMLEPSGQATVTDMNGRVLAASRTNSASQEIRLGSKGVMLVIVGNKTYRVSK
jgi:hypothetical protein